MQLIVATSNLNKIREIEAIIQQPVEQVEIDLLEVQAVAVEEVIEQKAREAYQRLGKPALVEDTGLVIHAWNGLPGALVRWFLKTVGPSGICQMLDGFSDRSAIATTCLGYFDGTQVHTFSGQIHGEIATSPRGERGFGWDPIFVPDGSNLTFAEMSAAEKDEISMRRQAVEKLKAFLFPKHF